MKVTLLHYTPLWVASGAIRTCWASGEKSDSKGFIFDTIGDRTYADQSSEAPIDQADYVVCGEKDKALIERIGNKFKHKSTLEHLDYNFSIVGMSRAVLQELARHRTASLSVKSSRYTLKELKDEAAFVFLRSSGKGCKNDLGEYHYARASGYIVMTGDEMVDRASITALNNLRAALKLGISNDKAKYCMPEAYKTELTWTMDARNLQSFLALRTDKAALWEIRQLAQSLFDALPSDHKYLFEQYIYESAAYIEDEIDTMKQLAKRYGYSLAMEVTDGEET